VNREPRRASPLPTISNRRARKCRERLRLRILWRFWTVAPPPRTDSRGRPYRPPTPMVYPAYSLLVQCYGTPLWNTLLPEPEMAQAIADARVLHVCSVHGPFASGDVIFRLVPSFDSISDSSYREEDILIFSPPCRLTTALVGFLNDNPWERAYDMRKVLQGW
jgi:hypothetical protein